MDTGNFYKNDGSLKPLKELNRLETSRRLEDA